MVESSVGTVSLIVKVSEFHPSARLLKDEDLLRVVNAESVILDLLRSTCDLQASSRVLREKKREGWGTCQDRWFECTKNSSRRNLLWWCIFSLNAAVAMVHLESWGAVEVGALIQDQLTAVL